MLRMNSLQDFVRSQKSSQNVARINDLSIIYKRAHFQINNSKKRYNITQTEFLKTD